MTFNYDRMAATSLRLLTNFGQSVTRRTYTAGTYDPNTGTTTPTTADTTRIGALFDYGSQNQKGEQYVRGNLVIVGDKQLLLDAEGAATVTDRYIIGGVEYTCMSVATVNPAGTAVMYDIHLRLA
jgi:hypothetical protein